MLIFTIIIFTQPFTTQSQHLMTLKKNSFENIEGTEENAGYQHFLLFPSIFSYLPVVTLIVLSANALNLNQSKELSCGEELIARVICYTYCLRSLVIIG